MQGGTLLSKRLGLRPRMAPPAGQPGQHLAPGMAPGAALAHAGSGTWYLTCWWHLATWPFLWTRLTEGQPCTCHAGDIRPRVSRTGWRWNGALVGNISEVRSRRWGFSSIVLSLRTKLCSSARPLATHRSATALNAESPGSRNLSFRYLQHRSTVAPRQADHRGLDFGALGL